jgi:predicted DNA-binding transcriptional regulator AlpA
MAEQHIPSPLREREAATYLGLSVATLHAYRQQQRGPAYLRLGRTIRYLRADLDRYMAASRVDPSDAGTGPLMSGATR